MSGQDLRKIMNLMESFDSIEAPMMEAASPEYAITIEWGESGTPNPVWKFKSQKDEDILVAAYDTCGMSDPNEVEDYEGEATVPAGALKQFYKVDMEDQDIACEALSQMIEILAPYTIDIDAYFNGMDESINEGVQGMDSHDVLWQIFEYGVQEGQGRQQGFAKAHKLIMELIATMGKTVGATPAVAEDTVMETGNANAQQKGINFSGTSGTNKKGNMSLSSPKSKAAGSKTPLAQAKSGTKVGNIKS